MIGLGIEERRRDLALERGADFALDELDGAGEPLDVALVNEDAGGEREAYLSSVLMPSRSKRARGSTPSTTTSTPGTSAM